MNSQSNAARNVERTGDSRGFITVRPLEDRRTLGRRISDQTDEPTLRCGRTLSPSGRGDQDLITYLLVSALRCAGFTSALYSESGRPAQTRKPQILVLEGQLWEFHFASDAGICSLTVDLSLTLRDQTFSALLWKADFPDGEEVPTWIGLGCRSERVFDQALRELVDGAARVFQSAEFLLAAGQVAASRKPPRTTGEMAHEIVVGSSWTGTEEGEILATAHESTPLLADELIPTVDFYADLHATAGRS